MTGNSDNNRSEGQGGCREALSTKAVWSEGTTVGTRTGSEAAMRAMSVLENAKSNRHRKTHRVEPDGTGRKFMHLTRGDLPRESAGEVSRGRSSEDRRVTAAGAKGRRMQETNEGVGKSRSHPKRPGTERNLVSRVRWAPRTGGPSPATHAGGKIPRLHERQRFPEIQPPDAENRMSGGVEGSRGAIPVTPSDLKPVIWLSLNATWNE